MKERLLGIAKQERRYDIPLSRETGIDFLSLLISLMTFLAVMALAASFVLSGMAHRWTSGLENKITIEIPAETSDNTVRTPVEIKAIQDKAVTFLKDLSFVKDVKALSQNDIQTLLQPWMGSSMVTQDIPLPGLISLELKDSSKENLKKTVAGLNAISSEIVVDTHEQWLTDLLRLTSTLQFITFIITAIIGGTTITAVAGGVKSRIAIHRADVELLHLMGAEDNYITRQFQRYTMILALKGGGIGLLCAVFVIFIIKVFSVGSESSLLPAFSLNPIHILIIFLSPVIAAGIAAFTARFTVLHALREMP